MFHSDAQEHLCLLVTSIVTATQDACLRECACCTCVHHHQTAVVLKGQPCGCPAERVRTHKQRLLI